MVNVALNLVIIYAVDFMKHSGVGKSLASKKTLSPAVKRRRGHDKATDDGHEGVYDKSYISGEPVMVVVGEVVATVVPAVGFGGGPFCRYSSRVCCNPDLPVWEYKQMSLLSSL
jgi:hypothetical protein